MSLREYNRKRKFSRTPEPPGKTARRQGPLRFVIQLHRATRLHYDFRLEMGGVFKSWAVPRGPSLNPMDQRLAVFVEDHPIPYGSFEGIIPKGNYGAGTVMIWDQGTYEERGSLGAADSGAGEGRMLEGLESGHMTFVLNGERLQGEFALIRLKREDEKSWLLVKKRDEFATYKIRREDEPTSAATGRTLAEIAAQAEKKGEIWLPRRTLAASESKRALKPVPEPKALARARPVAKPLKAPSSAAKRLVPAKSAAPARRASMPRRVKPMLPRLEQAEAKLAGWLFCGLAGGHRAIAEVEGPRAHLYSRSLLSFDRKQPELIEALERSGTRALLDGEIADDGRYRVFDLLYVDGEDLRPLPLRERIKRLKRLEIFGPTIELCEQLEGDGTRLWKKSDVRQILARDGESDYRSGVSPHWIEIRGQDRKSPSRSSPSPATPAGERGPVLSHPDKLYWKREGITKGDLIEYYRQVAPVLLPHLEGRPMSLHRFPGGAEAKGFYQKDYTGYKPRWVETHRLYSESAGKSIDYVVCQNEWTLLHLANLGCIEMNPWLSRTASIERPDWLVIDIDPDRHGFDQVVQVALEVRKTLERIGAQSFCKTSGATGMHVCVPLGARFEYEKARVFAEAVCQAVQLKLPSLTTLERNPARRGGRMYLDFMQNRIGQTLASPYSVRPRPGATVSTPLRWSEVTRKLDPTAFTMRTTPKRLERLGDLWTPMIRESVDIDRCLKRLGTQA